jgi:hypothetical protein
LPFQTFKLLVKFLEADGPRQLYFSNVAHEPKRVAHPCSSVKYLVKPFFSFFSSSLKSSDRFFSLNLSSNELEQKTDILVMLN